MNELQNLQQALRTLAGLSPRDAGPLTQQRLHAAFRARRKRSPRRWTFVTALAASLALACAFLLFHSLRPSRAASNQPPANAFIALPYAQSDVPIEQAVIVRVRLQPPEWAAFGLPPTPAPFRAAAINADLLIAQDGIPRAVRFVGIQ
jgi:hypothetical protein